MSREHLGQASKLGYVPRNDASSLARITCALSLEMLSELLRREWTFSIRIDASTDSYDNSLLESHVRLSTEADICNFYVVAIPMYDNHNGEAMFELLNHFLTAIDSRWRQKMELQQMVLLR